MSYYNKLIEGNGITTKKLKSLGIEGEWEGIGHCILGYPDEPITDIPKRKENRVYYIK